MNRKEEIIYATLELASEYGLKSVSLSQIADKVGIKKPSLYNHFKSKEELVTSMYTFLREKAKQGVSNTSQVDVFPEDNRTKELQSNKGRGLSGSILLPVLSERKVNALIYNHLYTDHHTIFELLLSIFSKYQF